MSQNEFPEKDPAYGWVMVGVGTIIQVFGFGAIASITVFIAPLSEQFGWSRGDLSFAYTSTTVTLGLGGLVMGYLSDKFPIRFMVLLGSLVMGLCMMALGQIDSLWQLYLLYGLIGFFGFGSLWIPMATNLRFWMTRNLGLAMGIVTAGSALGQGIIPFIGRLVITEVGWSQTYTLLGLAYLAGLLPMIFLVRVSPNEIAAKSGQAGASPIADVSYGLPREKLVFLIGSAAIFCCITMATPIVHVVPLAMDLGFDPKTSAGMLTVMMIAGIFGRLATGKLIDAVGVVRGYIITSLAQTALVFWFATTSSLPGLYVLSALFGFGYAGVMTSIIVSAQTFGPVRWGGLSMGFVTLFGWSGMGLGGYFGGLLFDLSGNYSLSFGAAAISGVINLLILMVLFHYTERKKSVPVLQPA